MFLQSAGILQARKESFPLDAVQVDAAAAYSLRLISGLHTGPVIRIRRSSDNAELDIGANNNFDTALFSAFVGAGEGRVITWYDQSGNGFNITQSDPAMQPLIVLNSINGYPSVQFDGSNDRLVFSGAGLDILRNVSFAAALMVKKYTRDGTARHSLSFSSSSAGGVRFSVAQEITVAGTKGVAGRRLDDTSVTIVQGGDYTADTWYIDHAIADYANADAFVYENGATIASSTSFITAGSTSNTASQAARVGCSSADTAFLNGSIAEIIIYNATVTRQIVNYLGYDQSTYYGVAYSGGVEYGSFTYSSSIEA